MSNQADGLYEFGPFCLDTSKRLLTRGGEPVTLAPKTFELLLLLAQSEGRALSKRELMSALWPDTFVEEANLSYQITTLRKALGEEGDQWIETVPKHGYRFTAAVAPVAIDGAPTHPVLAPRAFFPWVIAGLASVIALVFIVLHFRERPPAQQPFRFSFGLPGMAPVNDLSLSPDGRYLAISTIVGGKGALWICTFRPGTHADGSTTRYKAFSRSGRGCPAG
jgi:DNA-binding winged helix-turn-helix (wHTH) protein